MNDEERRQLYLAYELIVKLAKAVEIVLGRVQSLEQTVTKLEADALMRRVKS